MVVIFHTIGGLADIGLNLPPALSRYSALGSAGVDVFFVISGFVIFLSVEGKTTLPGTFLKNRLIRIAPAYWALTLLAVFATFVANVFGVPNSLPKVDSTWLVQSLTFSSHFGGHLFPILYQGWSLEYEMLFYVSMSVALFFSASWARIVVPIAIVSTLTLTFGFSPRAFEFVCGLIIAAVVRKGKISAFWGILAASCGFVVFLLFPSPSDLVAWTIGSVALVVAASTVGQVTGDIWKKLGSASYPIYLLQWFTVPVSLALSPKLGPDWLAVPLTLLIATLATAIAGLVFDTFFDIPLRNLLKRTLQPSPKSA